MERWRAMQYAHEGAVYLHRGAAFQVAKLDLSQGMAMLEPFSGDYFTQPLHQTVIESLVTVEAQGQEGAPVTIRMNQPLKKGGYVFFQASYQDLGDDNFVSVFSVAKDPGVWLKYLGSIILVAGIAFMFWFKKPVLARTTL